MKTNRFISIILSCVLSFSYLCVSQFTAFDNIALEAYSDGEDTILQNWDGTADKTWYDGEETVQYISTASELAGLGLLTQEGRRMEGQTFILENDISLKGYQWIPITQFYGTFDGNNHTISGMEMTYDLEGDSTETIVGGLFAGADRSTIQNLFLEDISVKAEFKDRGFSLGGIASGGGTIKDCVVTGTIECNHSSSHGNIGGIAASADYILRCKSNVNIIVNADSDYQNNLSIGGICGSISEGEISECCNYGNIEYEGNEPYLGIAGIVGLVWASSKPISVNNSYNRGDIRSSIDSYGIIGRFVIYDTKKYDYTISNVYNTGKCNYGIYKTSQYMGKTNNMYYSTTCAEKGTDGSKDLATPKPLNNMKKEAFVTSLGSAFAYVENDLPVLKWELNSPLTATTTTTSENTTTTTETTSTTTETSTTIVTTTSEPTTSTVSTDDSRFVGKWIEFATSTNGNIETHDANYGFTLYSDHTVSRGSGEKWECSGNMLYLYSMNIYKYEYVDGILIRDIELSTKKLYYKKVGFLGDPNEDGNIDAKDASFILAAYAKSSTGDDSGLTDEQKVAADVNYDGLVDAKDASMILAYYSYISTGGTQSLIEYNK